MFDWVLNTPLLRTCLLRGLIHNLSDNGIMFCSLDKNFILPDTPRYLEFNSCYIRFRLYKNINKHNISSKSRNRQARIFNKVKMWQTFIMF